MSDPYTSPDFPTAALITIDTQRDVLDDGPLEIPGTSAALGAMRVLVEAFRNASRPIAHIVRLYRRDGANVDLCRRNEVEEGGHVLTPGTPGSQLASPLLPSSNLKLEHESLLAGSVQALGPRESAIYKPRWGAFYETPLEEHLRGQGVTTLVFCGCNFPNCPRTSIYEASERDFRVVLARDAVRASTSGAKWSWSASASSCSSRRRWPSSCDQPKAWLNRSRQETARGARRNPPPQRRSGRRQGR